MKYYHLTMIALTMAIFSAPVAAQTARPGDVDPKARYLDVDIMYEFNNGAAIVEKGSSQGLIDMNGNFVAAFNKYKFNYFDLGTKGVYDGIFPLNMGRGALNARGELIAEGLTIQPRGANDVPYRFALAKGGIVAVNSDNQQFLVKGPPPTGIMASSSGYSEGLRGFIPYTKEGNRKNEYRNLKDEVVIPAKYDAASPFSNGMAIIGNKNEFGEMKYGFVSADGREVIAPVFSNKPSDFTCGRSMVTPKTNAEFENAFINKKGDIVIKITREMIDKYGRFDDYFYNDYTFNSHFVMDTAGKILSHAAFFAKFGVANPEDKYLKLILPNARKSWTEGQVFAYTRQDYNNRIMRAGFIDVLKNKAVEGPFTTQQFYFDPVSNLAYAESMAGKDNAGNAIIRKGYINRQGVFVIVKGESSKW